MIYQMYSKWMMMIWLRFTIQLVPQKMKSRKKLMPVQVNVSIGSSFHLLPVKTLVWSDAGFIFRADKPEACQKASSEKEGADLFSAPFPINIPIPSFRGPLFCAVYQKRPSIP